MRTVFVSTLLVWLLAGFVQFAAGPALAQDDPPVEAPVDLSEAPPPPDVPPLPPPEEAAEPLAGATDPAPADPSGPPSEVAEPPGEETSGTGAPAPEAALSADATASASSAAAGDDGDDESSVVDLKQSYDGANGSFVYRVPLGLPPARGGIQPDLQLVYNSSRKLAGGGESQGWLGFGWALSGLDVIERATERRGTPRYDEDDIYLWNGEEVLRCPEAPSSGADKRSISCKSGGSHFTKVESYLRFEFQGSLQRWIITKRNGIRHTLSPVGDFIGGSAEPGSPEDKHRTRYRWPLSRIEDPHGNWVNFTYNCPNAPQCYIDRITYPGSEVAFYWETRPDPVSYGTGVGLGRSSKRMTAVRVKHGEAVQKALVLGYEQNPTSGLSRIVSVKPYGKDVQLNADGEATAGTGLPAQRFEYSNTAKSFTAGPDPNLSPANDYSLSLADANGDGAEDLLASNESSLAYYDFSHGGPVRNPIPWVRSTISNTSGQNSNTPQTQRLAKSIWFGHLRYADQFLDIVYRTVDAVWNYSTQSYSNKITYYEYLNRTGAFEETISEGPLNAIYVQPNGGYSSEPPNYLSYDEDGNGTEEFVVPENDSHKVFPVRSRRRRDRRDQGSQRLPFLHGEDLAERGYPRRAERRRQRGWPSRRNLDQR